MASPRDTSLRPRRTGLPRTSLHLLGAFDLRSDDVPVTLPPHAERLLAFLAVQGRMLHRAYVAGRLWPDLSEEHAHGCLRTTLWRVGRTAHAVVVDATAATVGLDASVQVDMRELEESAERVLHDEGTPAPGDLDRLEHAGELLPDWYEDWALQERERFRLLRLLALEAGSERLLAEGRYSDASQAALAALCTDPLRESAHRLLIRAALGEGNAAEALRQFASLRVHLHDELGLEPSAQTQELIRGIA